MVILYDYGSVYICERYNIEPSSYVEFFSSEHCATLPDVAILRQRGTDLKLLSAAEKDYEQLFENFSIARLERLSSQKTNRMSFECMVSFTYRITTDNRDLVTTMKKCTLSHNEVCYFSSNIRRIPITMKLILLICY